MPENFTPVGSDAKLWLPFAFRPDQTTDDARHSNNWGMIARLKPGVTLQAAQRRIDGLNRANLERVPRLRKLLEEARFGTRVVGLKDEQVRDARPLLYLVQAAVAFVLLIGCVNVANLMLVRANVRMKELAIRFSLGADRWRLSRQLLTESVLIAVLGGGLGTALGFGGVRLLSRLQTTQLPPGVTVQIDLSVLMFSAALAVLTGLVFGSIPVFHVIRRDLNETFRGGGRTGTSERGAVWTRSALVVSQVAIAFVLLAGAGLLTLSFIRLLNVNPGFQPDNLLTARFSLPDARYKDDARVRSFVTGLVENVRALPGVKQAGVTTFLPFSDNYNASAIIIEGYQLSSGELPPVPGWNVVDEGYLPAMGIRVLRGRGITSSDADTTQKVVLIDEFLERKYWAGRNPIGTRILRGLGDDKIDWTIVGVVSSVKTGDLASQKAIGQIYFPHRQFVRRTMHLVVRTDRDDTQLTSAIRRQVMQADPELALFDVKTMPQRLSASVANQRAAMAVCLAFATLALLLAAIGIYGVLSYTVTQRTREFGIRAALGAGTKDVLAMVLGQGMKVAAVGLVIGVAGAWALTSLLTTLLYDVKPADPGMLLLVSAVLMIVALVAALVPSVRAVRIRPAVALRTE
jgi:predicted permease